MLSFSPRSLRIGSITHGLHATNRNTTVRIGKIIPSQYLGIYRTCRKFWKLEQVRRHLLTQSKLSNDMIMIVLTITPFPGQNRGLEYSFRNSAAQNP